MPSDKYEGLNEGWIAVLFTSQEARNFDDRLWGVSGIVVKDEQAGVFSRDILHGAPHVA